jgi:SdpI/YfhL protein family
MRTAGIERVNGKTGNTDEARRRHKNGAYDMSFEYKMVLAGVVLFAIGIPLALKLVPPNSFYGVRTSKTRSSREIWDAANRLAGINMAIAGIVVAVAALVVPGLMPDYSQGARVLVLGPIVVLAAVIMVARILWQVRRL